MPSSLENENSPNPLRLTPRQAEVIVLLKKHHHDPERICRWFEGALHALTNKANPDRLAQAANSLREMLEKFLNEEGVERIGGDFKTDRKEIREGLKACSGPDLNEVQWEGKTITPELAKVFERIIKYLADNEAPSRREQTATAIANTNPLHAFTSEERQSLIRNGIIKCSTKFQSFTHHAGLSGSEGENRFMAQLDALETLLLLHFNPPMNEAMLAYKNIAQKEPSTVSNLPKILQGVRESEAVYELFFKELVSSAWVPILEEAGFFKNPPDIRQVGNGYVNFTVWWPLVFLHRVAAQVPELAVAICVGIPAIENPRPYFEMTRIAHAISDIALSIKLKDKLIEYADFPFHALGGEFGQILANWASGDAESQAAAVDLTGHLISFRVDPNYDPDSEGYHASRVKPGFRESQYTEILKKGVRPLADKAPLATARSLIIAVRQFIDRRYRNADDEIREESDDDYSTSWCKRVDAPYDDHAEEEEELIHTLTYACEKACQMGEATALQLDELLRDEHWKIFRRIRHHLYSKFPNLFKTQIQNALVGFQGYEETEYGFEFAQLIRSACDSFGAELLTTEQLIGIFEQILAGPNREDLQADERYTPETIVSRCNYVVRRHLWPFESVLFGQYFDRFSELMPGHTLSVDDYLGWGGRPIVGEIVTKSPVPEGVLAAASDDDLVHILNTWTESEPDLSEMWIRRDREGLARAFAKIVSENPVRFGTWGDRWKSVSRPLFLIKALEEASKMILAEKHDQLASWMSLAERIVSKPLPPQPEQGLPEDRAESRSDWQWARTVTVSFLKACMDLKTGVSLEWRPRIWKMLRQLCCDTDFRLDDAVPPIPPSSSLISIAINCTRGPALESLILYAAWLDKGGEAPAISSGNQIGGLLDERFAGDPPVTWPELGLLASNIHRLWWVNPTWVDRNIGKLFRQDDFALWLPTFKAFIHYGHIRSTVFPTLRSQYTFALNHMDDLRKASSEKEKLVAPMGFHLALLFMWGSFPLTGEGSLLERFYQLATVDEKSDLMARLGQSINHSNTLDEPFVKRGIEFFEGRLALAESVPTEGREEFGSVNSWIQSKPLPPNWRLKMLRRVLLLRPDSEDFSFLAEFLVECLSTDLALAVECFALITELGTSQRYFYIQPKEGKAILRAGVQSGNETIKKLARAAQNNLLSVHRYEFIDLNMP